MCINSRKADKLVLSMFEISMDKRYENFIWTVCNCAAPVNALTDEKFRYTLFEVLSVDVFTVFSETNSVY